MIFFMVMPGLIGGFGTEKPCYIQRLIRFKNRSATTRDSPGVARTDNEGWTLTPTSRTSMLSWRLCEGTRARETGRLSEQKGASGEQGTAGGQDFEFSQGDAEGLTKDDFGDVL